MLGKPVIATAYSGNLDLMAPEHSYMVPYRLVELPYDHPPYEAGMLWAEPHIVTAAEYMRQMFANPDEARERGRLAARFIREHFHPSEAAARIRARLRTIENTHALLADSPRG